MKSNKWILAILWFALPLVTRAQDSLSVELQADVVSQYIWRGLNLGHISVQPEMALGWKGLRLSAWGNVGLDSKDTREVDLTLSYETGGLSLGVIDYWSDNNDSRYFYYKTPETGHALKPSWVTTSDASACRGRLSLPATTFQGTTGSAPIVPIWN